MRASEALSCRSPFDRATDAIARAFAVRCPRCPEEVPKALHAKVLLMLTNVREIKPILLLRGTPVGKIMNLLQAWDASLESWDELT